MTNITYADKSFGTKEEVITYLEKVRQENMRKLINKREFKNLYNAVSKNFR